MTKKEKAVQAAEAKTLLLQYVKAGTRIYTALRHVSSNGMSRRIRTYVITQEAGQEAQIWDCTRAVARLCGYRYNDDKGDIVIGGVGMDMGYNIVYALGRTFWPTKEMSQAQGYITNRNGDTELETDGGYLLKHSWL